LTKNPKIVASLAAAGVLLALVVGLSFRAFSQVEAAAEMRRTTDDLIGRTESFLSEMRDAETAQRGFMLTGVEAFLEPYVAVRDVVAGHLAQLRSGAMAPNSLRHLDALVPLTDQKLAHMDRLIEYRRHHDAPAGLAAVGGGEGKRLMDAIRLEVRQFIEIEAAVLAKNDTVLKDNMGRLFWMIVAASVLALLFAISFVYLISREVRHRLANVDHLKIRLQLDGQEGSNVLLQELNSTLQVSEELLAVTLNSIGDAVIATDAQGRVTRLNTTAARLTGWTQQEAMGRPVTDVFHIINQETRAPSVIPVMETLAKGTVQGLANHTILVGRDQRECAIADSCAPIRNRDGQVVGAVLVFRDVTEEYAAQQALRDSAAMIRTMLNTIGDGMITIHASGGLIETVNPAAERIFGYVAAELVGQNFTLLIPELDKDIRSGSLEYYSAGAEARAAGLGREVTGRRKDGGTFPLEIVASEMWLGGKRYFTGVLRDVTVRKRVEAERNEAMAVAEKANLAKSDFCPA
jgi:PAS domain S-box-containing protein